MARLNAGFWLPSNAAFAFATSRRDERLRNSLSVVVRWDSDDGRQVDALLLSRHRRYLRSALDHPERLRLDARPNPGEAQVGAYDAPRSCLMESKHDHRSPS